MVPSAWIVVYNARLQAKNTACMINVLKFQTLYSILFSPKFCFSCTCFLKYLVEMANSVDPNQTRLLHQQSDLGLCCLLMPFCQQLWYTNFSTFTIFLFVVKNEVFIVNLILTCNTYSNAVAYVTRRLIG